MQSAAARLAPAAEISEFIATLRGCTAQRLRREALDTEFRRVELSRRILRPFLRWVPFDYARTIIHSEAAFELVAICWDSGSTTMIHDHGGQSCWTRVISGSLSVDTFSLANPQLSGKAGAGIWVEPVRTSIIAEGDTEHCDRDSLPHRVSNPTSLARRAVTLSLYAAPIRKFIVYEPRRGRATLQRVERDD